jgi:predicted lysophospholipase L1 biosynthesis ABC-type transport system permease subunit
MNPDPKDRDVRQSYIILRIRRRSWREWLVLILWALVALLMEDFALANWRHGEIQAAVIVSCALLVLLLAGIALNVMWGIERQEAAERGPAEKAIASEAGEDLWGSKNP